jgi:hypothetical protein
VKYILSKSKILTAWSKSSGELDSIGKSQRGENEDDGLHGDYSINKNKKNQN